MAVESTTRRSSIFNRNDCVASGWYWLLPSASVKRGAVKPASILGYDLAVYRGADGQIAALDAYCPHMGAHLCEGKVEGNQLRCFFHNWCFSRQGECTDIPSLLDKMPLGISTRAWNVTEQYGLIWVWLGESEPTEAVPVPPELAGGDFEYAFGKPFRKNCHPNVVMINAIDEQHFQTVHHIPGHILSMEPTDVNSRHIAFRNSGRVPARNVWGRLFGLLYKDCLTYNLDYWYGSTGTVTLGPDLLHMYIMFALRQGGDGNTEGYAVAFTKRRRGLLGWLFNRVVLLITQIVGLYFAYGDTRVFQTIRFRFKTPVATDRAVLAFMRHLDQQQPFFAATAD